MESNSDIAAQLHTVRDFIRWGTSQFVSGDLYFGHGTDNALNEAAQLVLHVAGIPRGEEDPLLDARLTLREKMTVLELINQRVQQRIPVAYLTGEAWFAGLAFTVDSRVLIPRSPIAELIEAGFEPWLAPEAVDNILDLCTGGGCIGIACAHYFTEAQVVLADISSAALEVAQLNIDRFKLSERVNAQHSDLFESLVGQRFALIVSNPPYVDCGDLASMPAEFQHEPALALGSGDDGLDITRRILRQGADFLTDQGLLVVEVGNSGVALEQAFPSVPFTWLEFERGGHGVFVITRAELELHAQAFA